MTTWRPDVPHNDLPVPPGVEELETRAVLKAAIGANAALAQLDQAAASIPNPTVLINTIPLLEAQASSEIENIVTTTDALFRHLDDDAGADPATRETLRYRTALRVGFERTVERGLTKATATAVCTTIKGLEMDLRALPGTRIGNPVTGEITYSPPEGRELIAEKISEWEHFIHADDGMDPLIRMAAGTTSSRRFTRSRTATGAPAEFERAHARGSGTPAAAAALPVAVHHRDQERLLPTAAWRHR